jgi:putative FmdB family regulatory protein
MPIYEYLCRSCGQEFEELVRGDEQPACPACGEQQVEKQMSVPAAHTANSSQPACPSREACGASSKCCGQNCGMAQWT